MTETEQSQASKTTAEIELKGEDITPDKDGGVLKEILKPGSSDEKPLPNDKVFVHYVGTLLDGTKFDSSRDRNEKFEFELGKEKVIKAWDIGVATMSRGEICRLICKPAYAYGEKGSGEKIPPNATLVFEIELFDFTGEDISENKDHSIVRRVLKKGESWARPNEGAAVEVSLKGTHEGRVFDERTVKFTLGEGFLQNIVPGVEQTIMKMLKGEHCHVKLKSKVAWDKTGDEKFKIPPMTNVEYELILINFEKAKDSWQLNDVEKLEQSDIVKNRAAELFKEGHYRVACKKYQIISEYLQSANYDNDSDKEKCRQLKLSSQSNIALCHLKLQEYTECIRACDKALEIENQQKK